jgi:glycosyltransferase involved in cell wall biosynthesis
MLDAQSDVVDSTKQKNRSGLNFRRRRLDLRKVRFENLTFLPSRKQITPRQMYNDRKDKLLQSQMLEPVINQTIHDSEDILLLLRSLNRTGGYDSVIKIHLSCPTLFDDSEKIAWEICFAYGNVEDKTQLEFLCNRLFSIYGDQGTNARLYHALLLADCSDKIISECAYRIIRNESRASQYNLARVAFNSKKYELCISHCVSKEPRPIILKARAQNRLGLVNDAFLTIKTLKPLTTDPTFTDEIINSLLEIGHPELIEDWSANSTRDVDELNGAILTAKLVEAVNDGDVDSSLETFTGLMRLGISINKKIILRLLKKMNDIEKGLDKLMFEAKNNTVQLCELSMYASLFGFDIKAKVGFQSVILRYLCKRDDEKLVGTLITCIWQTSRLDLIALLFNTMMQIDNHNTLEIEFAASVENISRITGWSPLVDSNIDRNESLIEVIILREMLNNIVPTENHYHAEPRRVLLVNNSLKIGGAERQVARCLSSKGHDSSLAVWNIDVNQHDNSFIEEVEQLEITIHDYSSPQKELPPNIEDLIQKYMSLIPNSPTLNPNLLVKVRNLCAIIIDERPSTLFLWQDTTNIIGAIAGKICNVPRIIMSARSLPPFSDENDDFPNKGSKYYYNNRYVKALYSTLLESPQIHLCHNSKKSAEVYAKWLNIKIDDISILNNGFDMKRMTESMDPIENKIPVVGTVFRFVDVKRPEMWIEVARRVHQELNGEVIFRLIGDGPRMESCKSIVKEIGLEDSFELLGFRNDVLAQLNSFDVFLMTSSIEGLPNVLIEAQAMGVPVVTTDVGGASETFIDGVTGHLVSANDTALLCENIVRIIRSNEWKKNAQSAGIEYSRQKFSVESMHEKLDALLWGDN